MDKDYSSSQALLAQKVFTKMKMLEKQVLPVLSELIAFIMAVTSERQRRHAWE
jgi:hypothetical protein